MNYGKLQGLREKLYFTVEDVADVFAVKRASARVLCNRYVRKKIFLRLKNNFYVLEQNWRSYSRDDFFKISNFLQVPSYVSFMTALSFYEVTTQVQRNYYESASLKRSVELGADGSVFVFRKLKKEYYFGFNKRDNIFIATKEKALIDAVYLYSFGKYRLDFSSLDLEKLDKVKLRELLNTYPENTKRTVKELCGI